MHTDGIPTHHLPSDDFAAMAIMQDITDGFITPGFGTRSNKWNNRDRNGRFAPRPTHIDAIPFDGGWNDEAGVTHGFAGCADAVGHTHHVTSGFGWMCAGCVWVPVPDFGGRVNTGSMECRVCGEVKSVKKFPTTKTEDRERDNRCRDCRDHKEDAF